MYSVLVTGKVTGKIREKALPRLGRVRPYQREGLEGSLEGGLPGWALESQRGHFPGQAN